jgi:GT2 family glycosyltransferase
MKIGYVCTNFNNSAYTVAAVDSLLRNAGHVIHIVVVDNASREEEIEKLRLMDSRDSRVQVLECKENLGYFRGLNAGLAALRQQHGDIEWVVVGNNDLEFPPDFCDRLERQQSEYRSHSVISPDIVTLDGEHQNPHVISRISPVRELFYDLYYSNYYIGMLIYKAAKLLPGTTRRGDEDQWQTARPIYQGHGSCYLLTPKFFAQFNELWAPTFLMSEEYFLSLQLKRVGEQVYYSPAISVTHHWHGALQNLPSKLRWTMARSAHREYRKYVKVFFNGPG